MAETKAAINYQVAPDNKGQWILYQFTDAHEVVGTFPDKHDAEVVRALLENQGLMRHEFRPPGEGETKEEGGYCKWCGVGEGQRKHSRCDHELITDRQNGTPRFGD